MDGVPRSWKSHERRSSILSTHVLRKTCIRMENQRDLIERIRAEQARLVNSRKRAFQPENIHDDDGTSQRNPINEFITISTAALLNYNLLDVEIIFLTKRNVSYQIQYIYFSLFAGTLNPLAIEEKMTFCR